MSIIKKFLVELEKESLTYSRKQKYVFMFKELKKLKVNPAKMMQKDADKYFFYLLKSSYADETKLTKWKCFKRFCRFSKFKIELQHRIKVKERIPEILTHEEIGRIVTSTINQRYRLLFILLYETGCRIGELLNLTKENIFFDDYGALIYLNGKTGVRPVRIIFSAKPLRKFLESNGASSRIFDFSNEFINRILKRSAALAGVSKKIHCHLFRHTRATELSNFLTDREMCLYFGWARNSNMPSYYSHLSFRDLDKKILELNGVGG